MAIKHIKDFKQEALRIALMSGLSRRQVASYLGVGFLTLSKSISLYVPMDLVSASSAHLNPLDAVQFHACHGA